MKNNNISSKTIKEGSSERRINSKNYLNKRNISIHKLLCKNKAFVKKEKKQYNTPKKTTVYKNKITEEKERQFE